MDVFFRCSYGTPILCNEFDNVNPHSVIIIKLAIIVDVSHQGGYALQLQHPGFLSCATAPRQTRLQIDKSEIDKFSMATFSKRHKLRHGRYSIFIFPVYCLEELAGNCWEQFRLGISVEILNHCSWSSRIFRCKVDPVILCLDIVVFH